MANTSSASAPAPRRPCASSQESSMATSSAETSGVTGLALGRPAPGDRAATARLGLWVLVALLVAAALISLTTGASDASLPRVIAGWFDQSADQSLLRDRIIVL